MNSSMISVVIPAYNSAKYILQAVDSALLQSVPIEIIVVDDCSTDNTYDLLVPYIEKNLIRYVKNDVNLGAAASRNNGISVANGDYVAFLDADDIWVSNKLAKQLDLINKTGCVLCATARELIDSNGTSTGRIIPVKSEISYKDLLKHNCINCSSVLIKTEIAKEFPMHSDDCHEDYIMWLEVLRKYGHACGVNEPLLKYRVSTSGKSGNKLKSAKMTFKVYRRMGFGLFKSIGCFISYTFNGIKKHYFGGKE